MIRCLLSAAGRGRLHQALGVMALLVGGASAHASDIYITADFKPDIDNPNQREFVNTTPWSGVCAGAHLGDCMKNQWWSIDTALKGVKVSMGMEGFGPDSFHIGMPPKRKVRVTSLEGDASHELDMSIIGAAMRLTDRERDGPRFGLTSEEVSPNCRRGISGHSDYTVMRMLLRTDGGQGGDACSLKWLRPNNYEIVAFDFTYALATPNPLKMRSGEYRGTTTYSVGGSHSGADFDLGDGVTMRDTQVTVHFTLTVLHAFQLDVPPGSDRAVLAPKGGWTQWSDHGVVPKSLERELPFMLSSSGQFSVSLRCQHPLADGRCAVRNVSRAAEDAPLDIRLTVPGFRDVASGADAVDLRLSASRAPPVLTADSFVIRRQSTLHFAVNGSAVEAMLTHPGSHYRGDVTVIFDADP